MDIDIQKLKHDIIDRANIGAMKSGAPELYHAIALLVAFIDKDYSQIEVNSETGWYTMKPKSGPRIPYTPK
jgi:hypothetical protein